MSFVTIQQTFYLFLKWYTFVLSIIHPLLVPVSYLVDYYFLHYPSITYTTMWALVECSLFVTCAVPKRYYCILWGPHTFCDNFITTEMTFTPG